jgi:DNA-binding SARP family transcriptional activator/uncharacterized protein HemY
MQSAGRLQILLLGPPLVTIDGQPLVVDTRKAIAILACLGLQPGPASRAWLASLLWPESDAKHARSALRRTLSTLNRALGGRSLAVGRDAVELLRDEDCFVDADAFASALDKGLAGDQETLAEAIELYRGDLLEGFALRDSPEFEEWIEPRTEGLRRGLLRAMEQLTRRHAEGGRYEQAAVVATNWLARDPLNETAYQWLMQLAAWRGDRSEALARYRGCVRVLDAELGVAPLAATTELYLAIREGNMPALPASAAPPNQVLEPAPSVVLAKELPFVGREQELERLVAALRGEGQVGRVVVVEGEAGIGKTRLLDEATSRMTPVLRAHCHPGESTLAYATIRDLLDAAIREFGTEGLGSGALAEAARLVPDALPGVAYQTPLESAGAQVRFFAGVAETLVAAGRASTCRAILIDDAQWLDRASADLLEYMIGRGSEYGIQVVFAVRTGDVEPGARELLEMARIVASEFIALGPLSADAIWQWVRAALGDGAALVTSERVATESEGLPLLVAQYISMLQGGAALEGAWELPHVARSLLETRLRSLDELDRQVLATAAAVGGPFEFETVRDASGRSEDEVLAAFERLEVRGFLDEHDDSDPGPRWEFTHDVLRRLAYESTTATRRRIVHRRLAAALRATGPSVQVAAHLQEAGLAAEAAAAYFAAGEAAQKLFANRDALSSYSAALALGHPDPGPIHSSMGDVCLLLGDFDGALRSYETAAAMSAGEALRQLEHKLGRVYLRLGEFDQARDRFQSALLQESELSPDKRAAVLADWSLLEYRDDDRDRARDLALEAHRVAESAESPVALARALTALGIIARREEQFPEAIHYLEGGLRLAEEAGATPLVASALNALALTKAALNELDAAIAFAQQALVECDEQGDRQGSAAVNSNLADLFHLTGDEDASRKHLTAAATTLGEIGVVRGIHRPEVWRLVDW